MPSARTVAAALLFFTIATAPCPAADPPPNVLVVLADDLGYGDVSAFNPGGKIRTPNLDRLAAQGMRFTDAHSGSAVCTPTRYGLLTGRYAWRSRLKSGVLGGYSPPLIEPGRLTVASLLKRHGYQTGLVGKWHLGLDWARTDQARPADAPDAKADVKPAVDYARPFRNGPTAVGFDEFYGISASLDMPPYVFLRNDRSEGLPTAERTYIRRGPAHPDFRAEDVLPALVRETVAFLDRRKGDGRPFFLELALASPHTPIVPTAPFAGSTGLGPYADFVVQTDAAVGQVLEALERNGQTGRTLVIVTSDNGCSPAAGFAALAKHGHHPSGPFRGTKADLFEGGHRVPFVARWPGQVAAGSTSDRTVCLTDLMATCAELAGATLPDDAGEDSVSFAPALLGRPGGGSRGATVHHSINGSFAVRDGDWKLLLAPDSGGWSDPKPGGPAAKVLPAVQLYNLRDDPAERDNLGAKHPDVVRRLTETLDRIVADGRSTPGKPQKNHGRVVTRRPAGGRN